MSTPDVNVAPRGTFGFSRKLSQPYPQYESAEATIFVQFDVDPDPQALEANIAAAAFMAKSSVFEQLGVEYVVDEHQNVRELGVEVRSLTPAQMNPATVHNTLDTGTLAQFQQPATTAPPSPTVTVTNAFPGATVEQEAACPKCNGPMYDNRASKKNPKQPDFKCKAGRWDKGLGQTVGCDGVIFPARNN